MSGTPHSQDNSGEGTGHHPPGGHQVGIHLVPGRMRLKGITEVQSPQVAAHVEKVVLALHGVMTVEVHAISHSVLVLFKSDAVTPERVVHVLQGIPEIKSIHGHIEWENHLVSSPAHPPAPAHGEEHGHTGHPTSLAHHEPVHTSHAKHHEPAPPSHTVHVALHQAVPSHTAHHEAAPSHAVQHEPAASHAAHHEAAPSHAAHHEPAASHAAHHEAAPSHAAHHEPAASHAAHHEATPSHPPHHETTPSHAAHHETTPSHAAHHEAAASHAGHVTHPDPLVVHPATHPPGAGPHHAYSPEETQPIVAHVIPGRLRVYGLTELHEKGVCTLVHDVLMHVHGVSKVDVDISNQSFQVLYDPALATPDGLIKVLRHQFVLKSLQKDIIWDRQSTAHPENDAHPHEGHAGHNIANKALMGAIKFALGHAASAVVAGPIIPAAGILIKLAGHPEPIHVLPERIRLKVPEMQYNQAKSTELKAALMQLPGMQFVDTHVATGCVVLRFRKNTVNASHVVQLLRRHGCLKDMGEFDGHHEKESWVKELVHEGAVEVAEHLLEGLLEFSV